MTDFEREMRKEKECGITESQIPMKIQELRERGIIWQVREKMSSKSETRKWHTLLPLKNFRFAVH